MKLPDGFGIRGGHSAAGALLLSATLFAALPGSAQQALPEAQPLNERPAAQRQQQAGQQQRQTQQDARRSALPRAQPLSQQRAGQQQQPARQQGQRQQGQQQSGVNPRAKDGEQSMFETRVADLRDTVVVDTEGASIGYVQDIVVKQDNSEAGLVISTGGEQEYVYVPLTEVQLEGEQLLLMSQIDPAPVSERELRDRNFNQVPDSERPLSDYIDPARHQGAR
jgi:sporulation protein YlmC with PRC-barrel domain